MKYKCSHCNDVFESTVAPKTCPLCKGEGKARYPKRLPAKRMTNKQRRMLRGQLDGPSINEAAFSENKP